MAMGMACASWAGMKEAASHRVLIVEDEPVSREALVTLLEWEGYDVRSAQGGEDAIALLTDWAPDVVVSDVSMPRGHGFGLVSALRRREDCRDTAILLMSARDDVTRRVSGLDIGADDFLGKPIDPEELLARIRVHLRNANRRRRLQRASLTDGTTGLLNRDGLIKAIHHEIERAKRNSVFSVLVFDLDHFKDLNDTFGHAVGDHVLEAAASNLRDVARSVDHCGRWGGDEFVVVLSTCDATEARVALERFRAAIEQPFVCDDGQIIPIRCSIGAATYSEGDAHESLLAEADRAMYLDKQSRHAELPAAL